MSASWIAGLAGLLVLTGCGGPSFSPLPQDPFGGTTTVAAETAITVLPPGMEGLRLATRRTVAKGTLTEDVILGNETALPRENRIRVTTRWRGTGAYFPTELPNPFTDRYVEERFAEEFPDAPFDKVVRERRNRRGTHRYLLADLGARGSCLFAWQVGEAMTELRQERHVFAIEFRFCVPGPDAEKELSLFDDLALNAPL